MHWLYNMTFDLTQDVQASLPIIKVSFGSSNIIK